MVNKEKIYVETSFDNIFLVDPNKIVTSENTVEDRFVKQEELIMYANLSCQLQPRSRLVVGDDSQALQTISIASINFLKPNNQDYLTTNWTELQSDVFNSKVINSELLGITAINYKVGPSFTPTITVSLEDVRGRALFESGNDSIYSVFFNLPYPTFYLTLKGYYGKAVRYPVILQKFQASMDQSSGNFLITLNFLGYKFNVLTDITQAELFAVPQMYTTTYNQNVQTTPVPLNQTNGGDASVNSITEQKGYKKIKEVYGTYKSKKLIAENFPELTVQQLITKLENFVNNILNSLGQKQVGALTDAETYLATLKEFRKSIVTSKSPISWFNQYLDDKNYFVITTNSNGENKNYNVYTYKTEYLNIDVIGVFNNLDARIKDFKKQLNENPTFGENGKNYKIPFTISTTSLCPTPFDSLTSAGINLEETAKIRYNVQNPTDGNINEIRKQVENLDNQQALIKTNTNTEIPIFFRLDGVKYFNDEVSKIEKTLEEFKKQIEQELTDEINKVLESSQGIGFKPTIRNIIAVVMASSDAFLRLLDDVHKKAFDSRNSNKKKKSVSQDLKNVPDAPVYPWPQFIKEIPTSSGEKTFDICYPGDPNYVSETGADDYQIWPEVEFVEEFIKAYLQRAIPPLIPTDETNDLTSIKRILVSGFDIPSNTPYSLLEDVSFFYEIWERILTISQYQGFNRSEDYSDILNYIQAAEATNIIQGLGTENVDLINLLRNSGLSTPGLYYEYLKSISNNGVGESWQKLIRGYYPTNYLQSEVNNTSEFITTELPVINFSFTTEKSSSDTDNTMVNYIKNKKVNQLTFTDTYPFIDSDWCLTNIANGIETSTPDKVYDTNKSLFYNLNNKKITNYEGQNILNGSGDNSKNRPLTRFYSTTNNINFNEINISTFYNNREDTNITEGFVFYNNYSGLLSDTQTTSIFNTPFYINAIQNDVENQRTGNAESPYVTSAYLFLNSLPLATLKEKYRTQEGDSELNLISSALKKYGGVHALPKLWVHRIGSIWYRYKNYIENGVDILDNAWTNFNVNLNYDPINSDPTKTYTLVTDTEDQIILQNSITTTLDDGTVLTSEILNLGFYPKVLNDFNYFYNGSDLYEDVNTIQNELQQKIYNGNLILVSNIDSSIIKSTGYTEFDPTATLQLKTWSVLLKNTGPNIVGDQYYPAPSFGSRYNQTYYECFENEVAIIPILNNNSVYDGSVRAYWGAPNFGYFDSSSIAKPSPEQYIKFIRTGTSQQSSFDLIYNGEYSNIEELFSVFTKEELDLFENEFLNFSKSSISTTEQFVFQTMMREIFSDAYPLDPDTDTFIENIQSQQNKYINSQLSSKLNLNVLYKKGNPTNFDYRDFSVFSNSPLTGATDGIIDYSNNTTDYLPSADNNITQAFSEIEHPEEWKTLKVYVGFSTIPSLEYTDTGSYITDFFIEQNIGFTVDNIKRFANIAKIFATRKLIYGGLPSVGFIQEMSDYINQTLTLRNNIYVGMFQKIQKGLPALSVQKTLNSTPIEGMQSKIEYYDMFKAVNDKWIAGNNYNSQTLFEDFLFLDRAGKDIGDLITVDVFNIKDMLKANPKANVYTIVTSIIQTHNFIIFSIPSYVNFYNVQTPGDLPDKVETDESFAEKLFGTFTEVDYQSSKPKIVCQYAEKPSEQLNNKSVSNGYNDDSFNFATNAQHPLIRKADDSGKSQKVVGFAVDFGLQNQSIFENINVSQDLGKATSESLQMEYDLANTVSGTKSSTQNASLYNIYKSRSYGATITSFGNAIIQPTMYFVLRNVPLFSGPYLITDVSHNITPSSFTTVFSGVRQRIHTLPIPNKILESIRSTFVTQLVNNAKNKKEANKIESTDVISLKNDISENIAANLTPSDNQTCEGTLNTKYQSYSNAILFDTTSNLSDVANKIKTIVTVNPDKLGKVLFTLSYIQSYNGVGFKYYNNNISNVSLAVPEAWGGNLETNYLSNEFICLQTPGNQVSAFATFENVDKCLGFTYQRYKSRFDEGVTNYVDKTDFITGFTKTWIQYYPQDNTKTTPNIYDKFVSGNTQEYRTLVKKIEDCWEIMKELRL